MKRLVFLLFVPLLVLAALPAAAQDIERVVILGFDGADAKLVERWVNEGKLPHLKALREEGGYAPIVPTNPPQTPVSWSTFSTGLDPGETTIFDFLRRKEGTYFPTFAMMTENSKPFLWGERNALFLGPGAALALAFVVWVALMLLRARSPVALGAAAVLGVLALYPLYAMADRWVPKQVPDPINNRQGLTMWEAVSEAGGCAEVFRMPATFPPDSFQCGWMLAGLGVPDVRGRVGTPSYYTTDPEFIMDENKFSAEIFELPEFDDSAETEVYGPSTKELFPKRKDEEEPRYPKRIDVPMRLTRVGEREILIDVGRQKLTLREGEWSRWVEFEFVFNPVVKFKGASRFYLTSAHPLKLNLLPINFHPADSPVPLTHPKDFAKELFKRFGFFKTIGWVTDTWSLDQELFDEAAFLGDMYGTVEEDFAMLKAFLDEPGPLRLYAQVFEFTDRIGHTFWRLIDPEHPRYDAALAERYGGEMLRAYQKMDEIVGEVMRRVDDRTLLFVVSDHGFGTWRYAVNYNTWLIREGFMALYGMPSGPKNLEDLFGGGEFFENVDWSRTKAYAMGLGPIYINLRGREPKGIVSPGEEYENVRDEIIEKLEAWVDEETGLHPVHRVYRREDIYRSYDPDTPDLRAANRPPYRVSWQTSLGGAPKRLTEPNNKKWSADHCSHEPKLVKGILFSNRPLNSSEPYIIDVYPTVLEALGLPLPDTPGKNVLAAPS